MCLNYFILLHLQAKAFCTVFAQQIHHCTTNSITFAQHIQSIISFAQQIQSLSHNTAFIESISFQQQIHAMITFAKQIHQFFVTNSITFAQQSVLHNKFHQFCTTTSVQQFCTSTNLNLTVFLNSSNTMCACLDYLQYQYYACNYQLEASILGRLDFLRDLSIKDINLKQIEVQFADLNWLTRTPFFCKSSLRRLNTVVLDIENYVDCCPDRHLSLSVLCIVVAAHVHSS